MGNSYAAGYPEDLWNAPDEQRDQGMPVFTVPHNGNVSNGLIYDDIQFDGLPLDSDSAGPVPVDNTVDAAAASYENNIGNSQLSVLWEDPQFDPLVAAFYYARAQEIPMPRWSIYDAVKLKVEAMDPVSIEEPAISSAIWYQPTTRE